jgi:hypothetical protein
MIEEDKVQSRMTKEEKDKLKLKNKKEIDQYEQRGGKMNKAGTG